MGFEDEQLGFNALHHSVQCYADSPANEIANGVKPTHLESIQSILCTSWGKDACLQQTRDGLFTALHLCCRSIVPEQITKAIATANPAAISMQDEEGDTPLHTAFRYGASEEIIQILIELAYSYCQDGDCCTFARVNDDGENCLHTAILHEASGKSVKLLLDADPQGILACNGRLQSPLHVACETGRYDIIDVILQSHASIDSVETLLKMRDEFGLTPIFILWSQACAMEMCPVSEVASLPEVLECIAMLLKFTEIFEEPSFPDGDKTLVAYQHLKTAIYLGNTVVPGAYVSFLVKCYPDILLQSDRNGRLPLHLATMNYQQRSHKDNLGIDSYQPNNYVGSSICTKAFNDHFQEHNYHNDDTQIIDILLNANTSTAFMRDNAGKLPLHLAIDAGVSWQGMRNLIQVNPLAIQDEDPVTGLLPFMSAAKPDSNHTREIVNASFQLLRSSPDVILSILEKSDRHCKLESSPRKRQRKR